MRNVVDHIDQVQSVLGRRMLLENPSTYVAFAQTDMAQVDFLAAIARRTGCELLLDVNNVYVAATNQAYDPAQYIRDFPLHAVGEIHLGGHDVDVDDHGARLLIDSHGAVVIVPVWDLYAQTIALAGAKPILIEWDNDVPDWRVLRAEAALAARILDPVA